MIGDHWLCVGGSTDRVCLPCRRIEPRGFEDLEALRNAGSAALDHQDEWIIHRHLDRFSMTLLMWGMSRQPRPVEVLVGDPDRPRFAFRTQRAWLVGWGHDGKDAQVEETLSLILAAPVTQAAGAGSEGPVEPG